MGTEIRLLMDVDVIEKVEIPRRIVDPKQPITVSMVGFEEEEHRGVDLLKKTMSSYLVDWWGFIIVKGDDAAIGDILLVNEDISVIRQLTDAHALRPVVLLSSARGDATVLSAVDRCERSGGWCRIVFKPSGPVRLAEAFQAAAKRGYTTRQSSPYTTSSGFSTSTSYYSTQSYFSEPSAWSEAGTGSDELPAAAAANDRPKHASCMDSRSLETRDK